MDFCTTQSPNWSRKLSIKKVLTLTEEVKLLKHEIKEIEASQEFISATYEDLKDNNDKLL